MSLSAAVEPIKTKTKIEKRLALHESSSETSRLSADIDAALFRKFKSRCSLDGEKMRDVLERLVAEHLSQR